MAFDLQSGYGLGAGADELRTQLRDLFAQALAKQKMEQDAQRIAIDQQRANTDEAYRRMALQSQDEARKAAAQTQLTTKAMRIANALKPGSNLDGSTVSALNAGDMGGLVEHKDATIGSRNLSGIAQAGTAPKIVGLASSANPGQAARDTFTGTAEQQQAEQARQDRQAQIEQARQDKIDAATRAKSDREDLIRLTASLRAPSAGAQPQIFVDQETQQPRAIQFVNGKAVEVPLPQGISKTAPPRMAPGVATAIAGADSSLHQLDKLEGMLPAVQGKIGPLAGRARDLGQNLPGVPVDQTYAAFKAESDTLKNATIKAITGAQMSEPEAKRIMGQIPSETDKPDIWIQKARATRDNISFLRNRMAELYGLKSQTAGAPDAAAKAQALIQKYGGG